MKKIAEKFYVIVERNNPQLGTYLSGVYVGKKRVNKESITCSFDYFGQTRSLRFSLHGNGDINGHFCVGGSPSCLYGSMSYYGFETAREAQIYLDRNWSTHYNYAKCSKALGEIKRSELYVNAK